MTEEAPDMPAEESDGMFVCPDCDVRPDSAVRWHLHRAACHNVPLSKAIFPPPSATDSYRQYFRGQWFRLSREGLFFEITEAHRARASRNLGHDVVLPLLVKGDKIRLKDGTCLRYGEGFEEESEPEAGPATTTGGGSRVPRGIEMRDDPDEQEQVRKLRERGSGSSAPVTPPKAKPRKGGRNKVSAFAEPSGTPPRPPSGPRAEARAAGLEYEAPEAASPRGAPAAPEPKNQPIVFNRRQFYRWGSWICYFCGGVKPESGDCFYQPVGGPFEGARCGSKRATGHWCPDDNIQPWSAPEDWRNTWSAERLRDYEDSISDEACRDDDHIAEVFTSRMQEIAERKAAKAERKHEAMAAIRASLTLGGWLCPGCDRWNLSFRDLCFRCNGKRTAAGVLSRGIPDPRRHDGDRAESDSDDSVELHVQREEQEQLEAMMRPFLRSTRTKRGSGSKKRGHPSGGTPSRDGKGKKGKGRAGAAAWLGVGVVAATCRGTGLVRGPALSSLVRGLRAQPLWLCGRHGPGSNVLHLGVGSPGAEPLGPHLHGQHQCLGRSGGGSGRARPLLDSERIGGRGGRHACGGCAAVRGPYP